MKWLEIVWSLVKNWIAPILAYFKGRYDKGTAVRIQLLNKHNKEIKDGIEHYKKVRSKYDNIRNDINSMSRERNNLPSRQGFDKK